MCDTPNISWDGFMLTGYHTAALWPPVGQFTSHGYSDNYNVIMVREFSFKYTSFGVNDSTKSLPLHVHQVADDYIICDLLWFKRCLSYARQ